jgi:hypothetical protein
LQNDTGTSSGNSSGTDASGGMMLTAQTGVTTGEFVVVLLLVQMLLRF